MRALLLALALTGCAVGVPPGFGDGESWSFPLVAPLEDDLLLAPVYLEGRAEPVLFMIDPDSAVSSIDNALQNELKPYSFQVPNELNERDKRVPVFVAEIKKIRVGELEVSNLRMRVHKAGTFWAGGRLVRGILGRDVIADSLLFSADRDRGMGMLATQGSLSPPPQASEIGYRNFFHRRLATVTVNKRHQFTMHLDLGARTTMLWGEKIRKAGLPKLNVRAEMQDEYGTTWQETFGGLAAMVEVGGARADAVVVVPYGDRRVDDEDIDGALGQNFFSHFNVTVNWHDRKFWLKRRGGDIIGTAGERLRRWGRAFQGCERPACVKVELVRGEAAPAAGAETPAPAGTAEAGTPSPTPSPPGPTATPASPAPPSGTPALTEIRLVREQRAVAASYEVLLEAVTAEGRSLGLPRLRATLAGGVPVVSERDLAPDYAAAATFLVLDASPFPRECERVEAGERCVWQQTGRM
jgi:hypothetical protein